MLVASEILDSPFSGFPLSCSLSVARGFYVSNYSPGDLVIVGSLWICECITFPPPLKFGMKTSEGEDGEGRKKVELHDGHDLKN